jgi:hypothetical protein
MGQHVYVNHFASEDQGRAAKEFKTRTHIVKLGTFPTARGDRVFMLGYSGPAPSDSIVMTRMANAGLLLPNVQFPRHLKGGGRQSAST